MKIAKSKIQNRPLDNILLLSLTINLMTTAAKSNQHSDKSFFHFAFFNLHFELYN